MNEKEKPQNQPLVDGHDKRDGVRFVPSSEPTKNEPTPERAAQEKARLEK